MKTTYADACAAVEAAEAAYNAIVKAYAVSSKCVSADIAAMFDARIAAELILCRAIISRDAARDVA